MKDIEREQLEKRIRQLKSEYLVLKIYVVLSFLVVLYNFLFG